ncbi:MAG TPA: hypothetical protein VK041_08105, partial [Opitutales bacterium]|nr:hypothetical protein [Opitutales bacterium]
IIAAEALRVGEDSPFYIALMDTTVAPDVPPPFLGFLNGDFEADPFDNNWSVNIGGGIVPTAGFAPGSDTAAFITNDGKSRLIQYFPQWIPLLPAASGPWLPPTTHPDTGQSRFEYMTSIGPKWQFGFYTAASTLEEDGDRSLNLILGHLPEHDFTNPNVPTINFRIIGTGGMQAFNDSGSDGAGWQDVFPAGTFEASEFIDGEFVDPSVFYLQFDGDYSTDDPYYVVSIRRVDDEEFFAVSPPMRSWQYGAPAAGSGIAMVHFHGFVQGPYMIDDLHLIAVEDQTPEGYAAWAETYFNSSEMENPSISGPNADPDGDGITNLLEYAFGGNPLDSDRSILPFTATAEEGGEEYLTITFTRPSDIDLSYEIEASGDLDVWGGGAVLFDSIAHGDGTITETYRDSEPIGESGRRFLRVHVSGDE